jgi:hypothetical protein
MNPKPRRTEKHDAALESAMKKLEQQEEKSGRKGNEPIGSIVRKIRKWNA